MSRDKTSILTFLLLAGFSCSDGRKSAGAAGSPAIPSGTSGAGTGGKVGTSGSPGTAGAGATGGSVASGGGSTGAGGAAKTGGSGGIGGETSGGSATTGGSGGTGGSRTGGATGSSDGLRSGPFKVLVLSETQAFRHASIEAGEKMLTELGATADSNLPMGAKPGSQFTVTIAKDDLSDFSEESLKNYELIFWMNPTGTVFTSGGANGMAGKAAIQKFMENGGAWAGVHSATDFEKGPSWPWFKTLVGGHFVKHDDADTPGSVVTQPSATSMDHPVIRGVPNPWSCKEEWYFIDQNPEPLPGFTILAKLASDQRPVTWTHELTGGGRAFYTIRGHSSAAFAEPEMRKLVLQGILWAVHRMK